MKRKRLKDTDTDFSAICNVKGTMEMILKDINEWARQEGLKGFEIAKAIHLESDPFSVIFDFFFLNWDSWIFIFRL